MSSENRRSARRAPTGSGRWEEPGRVSGDGRSRLGARCRSRAHRRAGRVALRRCGIWASRLVLMSMGETAIRCVHGRRVWDSRGRPTVEAEVELHSGAMGRAIAPAGASTGSGEAVDLRDHDGFDVRRAVANVNGVISQALAGADATDQESVDRLLIAADGTPDKRRLGGNATIAVSMATLARRGGGPRSAALAIPVVRCVLPAVAGDPDLRRRRPCGPPHRHSGPHGGLPFGLLLRRSSRSDCRRSTAPPAVTWPSGDCCKGSPTRAATGRHSHPMRRRSTPWCGRSKRQGLCPDVKRPSRWTSRRRSSVGRQVRLARDGRTLDSDGFIELLGRWIERYPIVSVEDPLAEDDARVSGGSPRLSGPRYR